MRNDVVIRNEPGEYRIVARYSEDGSFTVLGESIKPITLTVRVEDVWDRMSEQHRKYSYVAEVRRDEEDAQHPQEHGMAHPLHPASLRQHTNICDVVPTCDPTHPLREQ